MLPKCSTLLKPCCVGRLGKNGRVVQRFRTLDFQQQRKLESVDGGLNPSTRAKKILNKMKKSTQFIMTRQMLRVQPHRSDTGLMRKRRLIARYEFGKLNTVKHRCFTGKLNNELWQT